MHVLHLPPNHKPQNVTHIIAVNRFSSHQRKVVQISPKFSYSQMPQDASLSLCYTPPSPNTPERRKKDSQVQMQEEPTIWVLGGSCTFPSESKDPFLTPAGNQTCPFPCNQSTWQVACCDTDPSRSGSNERSAIPGRQRERRAGGKPFFAPGSKRDQAGLHWLEVGGCF